MGPFPGTVSFRVYAGKVRKTRGVAYRPCRLCRLWTGEVRNALQQAAPSTDHFWVLAGELERSETQWKHVPVAVDWKALAETGKDAWCVFRIHASGIGSEGWPEEVFARMADACLAEAHGAGMHLRGVQVDYDCPTEQLAAYGKWLRGVSDHLQGTALSITASWRPI